MRLILSCIALFALAAATNASAQQFRSSGFRPKTPKPQLPSRTVELYSVRRITNYIKKPENWDNARCTIVIHERVPNDAGLAVLANPKRFEKRAWGCAYTSPAETDAFSRKVYFHDGTRVVDIRVKGSPKQWVCAKRQMNAFDTLMSNPDNARLIRQTLGIKQVKFILKENDKKAIKDDEMKFGPDVSEKGILKITIALNSDKECFLTGAERLAQALRSESLLLPAAGAPESSRAPGPAAAAK